jgi:hypothetical protein
MPLPPGTYLWWHLHAAYLLNRLYEMDLCMAALKRDLKLAMRVASGPFIAVRAEGSWNREACQALPCIALVVCVHWVMSGQLVSHYNRRR